MPRFFNRILDRVSAKETAPLYTFEGITSDGRVVMRDLRGTRKAVVPDINTKSLTLTADPLAI